VDCQTCGRSLGAKPPALCIDDVEDFATASLHHARCRPAEWNDQGPIPHTGGARLSYVTRMVMMPLVHGEQKDPRPMLLVNPSLEMVFLERDDGAGR
jgi:hypothetical protein